MVDTAKAYQEAVEQVYEHHLIPPPEPWWYRLWMVLGARVTITNGWGWRWSTKHGFCVFIGMDWSPCDSYATRSCWEIQFTILNVNLNIRRREPMKVGGYGIVEPPYDTR